MLDFVTSAVDSAVSTVSTTQVLAMLVMSFVAVRWFTHSNKKMKLPPGPPGYPILGNLLDFRGTNLTKKSMEWKEKYGPVISFSTGPLRWVILTTVETVTEAFVERGADFGNRPSMASSDYITGGRMDIVMSDIGQHQQYRRKVAMQAIRQYMTGDQHTNRIHDAVSQSVDEMLSIKGPFDPHYYTGNISFNIVHAICYGYTRKPNDPTYLKIVKAFDATISDTFSYWEDVIPFLTYLPTSKYRQYMKNVDIFKDYTKDHIAKRKAVFNEKNVETLVDNVLLVQKQAGQNDTKKEINDVQVMYIVLDVFVAGTETTKTALGWVILMLATHQDVQKKCQDEIDSVLGDGKLSKGRLTQFVYTEAVVLEVLRLYQPLSTNVPHKTAKDTQVGGYDIPANTIVVTNFDAVHRDPRHWEKPDSFMPERFIEADGKTPKPRPKSWMPFSVGPRSCLGEFLAKANLIYSLAGLLQRLHFDMAPENKTPDFSPEDKWTFCVCKPYKVVVTERHV